MQANVTDVSGVKVIELSGQIDYDSAETFHKVCLKNLVGQKVVFDLSDLNFVGSSAIMPFLNTLSTFGRRNQARVRLAGVGPEFQKMIATTLDSEYTIYEDSQRAAFSFTETSVLTME